MRFAPRGGVSTPRSALPDITDRAPPSARDREICAIRKPRLDPDGLYPVGLDIIGDYLTEVNVAGPTGIQEIDRLDLGGDRAEQAQRARQPVGEFELPICVAIGARPQRGREILVSVSRLNRPAGAERSGGWKPARARPRADRQPLPR